MSATLPFAPSPCTFDAQALFTDGEFPCFQSPNRCLLLFSEGEFPRALVAPGGAAPTGNRVTTTQAPPSWIVDCDLTPEEIAVVLLLLDEE